MTANLYLGIDGGQSHTEAVLADERGRVLGRGRGGASNHAEQPGGRERLRRAIEESAGAALRVAGAGALTEVEFAAAHCAMTGGADFKEEVIGSVLRARRLVVGHDAPAALAGATAGEPGVVVIAGTGSVAYGEAADGRSRRVGGWGYLFGDEGSGFWIAMEAARAAMRAEDKLAPATRLGRLALEYFGAGDLMRLTQLVYAEEITRDRFASFARVVQETAEEGDLAAQDVVTRGADALARLAARCAEELGFRSHESVRVAPVGGVFRGRPVRAEFERRLGELAPGAQAIAPRFGPAVGALLLAYRAAGDDGRQDEGGRAELLSNLEKSER